MGHRMHDEKCDVKSGGRSRANCTARPVFGRILIRVRQLKSRIDCIVRSFYMGEFW